VGQDIDSLLIGAVGLVGMLTGVCREVPRVLAVLGGRANTVDLFHLGGHLRHYVVDPAQSLYSALLGLPDRLELVQVVVVVFLAAVMHAFGSYYTYLYPNF
jgi:uncharacterized membrane protein required for colicin V production